MDEPSGKAACWKPPTGLMVAVLALAIGSQTCPFPLTWAAKCFTSDSAAPLLSGISLFVVFRVAAAIGGLAGMVGVLVDPVHCPLNEFRHMRFGHA